MDRNEEMTLLSEIKHYLTAGNPVWDVDEISEACDMAIEALRNEINCVKCANYTERETYTGIKGVCKMDTAHREELISRQAAIRWVKTECNPYGKPTLDFESGKKVIEHLKQMPSVEPKTGKWVRGKYSWEWIEGTDGDLISRQALCEYALNQKDKAVTPNDIMRFPSADRPTDEEDQLKFYYVESIDDYWIGRRLDNFYYADWHEGLGFVWSKSRYLPWGEHIVDENTLWKEHTYPSEPIEIPFTEWIVGFVKKYFAKPKTKCIAQIKIDRNDIEDLVNEKVNEMVENIAETKTGKWAWHDKIMDIGDVQVLVCDVCGGAILWVDDHYPNDEEPKFCPNCGVRMKGADNESTL